MGKPIMIAGCIFVDNIKEIDVFPAKGKLSNIKNESKSVGGCVSNTAISLKKLSPKTEVYVSGCLGCDAAGEYAVSVYKHSGLNTEYLIQKEEYTTGYTDVYSEKLSGERTFFNCQGANSLYCSDMVKYSGLNLGIFHIGYALLLNTMDAPNDEYGTNMAELLSRVQKSGIKTSLDAVSEESDRYSSVIAPSLKYCNYLIMNEIESGAIARISARKNGALDIASLKDISKKLFELGVSDCVIIHAPEGASAMDTSGKFEYLPSLSLPNGYIKGSVGAGDSFCAGALYALNEGKDLTDILRIASCAAAANLSEADSVSGLRELGEVLKLEAKFKRQ